MAKLSAGHADGSNKKGHISINLGQLEDKSSPEKHLNSPLLKRENA